MPRQDLYTGPQAAAAFEWVSGKYADWKALGKWEYPVIQCGWLFHPMMIATTNVFAGHLTASKLHIKLLCRIAAILVNMYDTHNEYNYIVLDTHRIPAEISGIQFIK